MEVFASGGRTPAVRVLVCILCALFIFAVVAAPPAQAVALESVALFGLAAVLSAATAALGYKLSNNAQGKASLSSMCTAFANDAVMGAKVLVGMKIYGLQEGMKYIKMQVKNGKTYLDSKVVAWCQQYLAKNGVYDETQAEVDSGLSANTKYKFSGTMPIDAFLKYAANNLYIYSSGEKLYCGDVLYDVYKAAFPNGWPYEDNPNYCLGIKIKDYYKTTGNWAFRFAVVDFSKRLSEDGTFQLDKNSYASSKSFGMYRLVYGDYTTYYSDGTKSSASVTGGNGWWVFNAGTSDGCCFSAVPYTLVAGNMTGLSGSDTLGKDYINVTLEQILAGLKDWAKDWYDAGVESVLDGAAEGDIDLPLTVGAGAATLNPDVAADEDLVYYPPFDIPLEDVRSGSTAASDVTAGQEQAKTEANTADLPENQSIVNDFLKWALDYISIDKGLFAKFPLCIPYDAYLLACAAGGRDAVGGSSVFGASPGDLSGAVTSAQVSEQSDFTPVVHIKNDLQLSDQKVPIDIEIDLTPFSDMVAFGRAGISIVFIAGLIAAEYARIKGGKS